MKKLLTGLYVLVLVLTALYSYALVDPNITFIQNPLWVRFREFAIELGYYRRDISWLIYLGVVVLLFVFHRYFCARYKEMKLNSLVAVIAAILLLSYPFLSHDLFNYMFDARIFTFYGKNPYFFKALDFPADQWTRFMHWTHRTYPYGPVFLLVSFIPSYLGLGKFSLTFVLFKAMFAVFYAATAVLLGKMNKKWGVMFATHPLVLIEGLVSSHNDLAGVGLAVIGLYLLFKTGKNVWGRVALLLSAGIKYTTTPAVPLTGEQSGLLLKRLPALVRSHWNILLFAGQLAGLGYLSSRMGIQPWYFLTLFVYLPVFPGFINRLNIFFLGLLLSYYPYIRLGGWDKPYKVDMKNNIIYVFTAVNLAYLGYLGVRHWSHWHSELRKAKK